MKAENNSMAGGIFMLCGLIMLLTVPMVIGHYALSPATVAPATVNVANTQ